MKIKKALISALPTTAIMYFMSLMPLFSFSGVEWIAFTISSVMLVLGIGMFIPGADLAMMPMGTSIGSGLSRPKKQDLLWRSAHHCRGTGSAGACPAGERGDERHVAGLHGGGGRIIF